MKDAAIPFDLPSAELPGEHVGDGPPDGIEGIAVEEVTMVTVQEGIVTVPVGGADQRRNRVDDVAQLLLALAQVVRVLIDGRLQFLFQRHRAAADDLLLAPHGEQVEGAGPELVVVDGAAQEVGGAGFESAVAVVPVLVGGNDDDRNVETSEFPPAFPYEFGAVHLRHQKIGDDEIHALVDHPFEGRPRIVEGVNFSTRFQGSGQSGEDVSIGDSVVDHYDDRHVARTTSSHDACDGCFLVAPN